MIKRLYIHNFRCLENFELLVSRRTSALLVGKNGAGKSTVGVAIEILQRIARGTNRVGDLVGFKDFSHGRSELPIRFEVEVEIDGNLFRYNLAFELPHGFKEMRVFEECLSHNGVDVFARNAAQVTLSRPSTSEATFVVDWHLVALPIIQVRSTADPLHVFKEWLARMLILSPIPALISGDSEGDSLTPHKSCANFGEWFAGLMAHSPSAYAVIDKFVRQVMPDFRDIKNPIIGRDARSLLVQFQSNPDKASLNLDFNQLSDGEKCFFICAVVLASNESYGPVFCFWDEPDNYLSLSEVGQFTAELRRSFHASGQLLVTSHNSEAIQRFSPENTFWLSRHSHFEPTLVRSISDLTLSGSIVDALIRDEIEP